MSFKNKLKEAYSNKVTAPKGYQELNNKIEIKKTHHNAFKTIKWVSIGSLSLVGTFVLVIASVAIFSNMKITENFADSVKKARFSMYDTNLLESETFKRLNNITYDEEKKNEPISEDFVAYVNKFGEKTYQGFDKSSNFAYSPLMAYTQMDLISLALSDNEAIAEVDDALGTSNKTLRGTNVYNAMLNNSYADKKEKSTVQAKNAVFYDPYRPQSDIKQEFLTGLTSRRAEVYNVSYDSDRDINSILQWIDESVNEKGFFNKDDLDLDNNPNKYSFMMFVSSLYFDNAWRSKYVTKDTKDDTFYLSNGETVTTKFMNHVIISHFKDFGDYVSVKDDYRYGYCVEYFVPKKIEDSIFDVLPNDFLTRETEEKEYGPISLSVPKLDMTCKCEITDIIKGAGIQKMYDETGNCLLNACETPTFEFSYVKCTKQKTSVSFDEDGTVVKTVTFSVGNGGQSARPGNGYEVTLNQPFVYVIKDSNGLPLVLGAVNNPIA